MNAHARKAAGSALLLAYLATYALLAAMLGSWLIPRIPPLGQLPYFVAAGIIWIAPLKPLFGWMNKGAPPPRRGRDED